jgi:hypothetical protein
MDKKEICLRFFVLCALLLVFAACATRGAVPKVVTPPDAKAPVEKERPAVSDTMPIMGKGIIGKEKLAAFLLKNNPQLGLPFTEAFAAYYIEEAGAEGVNPDVAFSQMCLETGFLSFRGQVTPNMNNFAGLGTTGPGNAGEHFPSPRLGVRAQIQHLKGYATSEPLRSELVDTRYKYIRLGCAPSIAQLAGTWAADHEYGKKILTILERLYDFAKTS